MILSVQSARSYAVAAAKKGAEKTSVKTKQVFRKKIKDSKISSANAGQIVVNRTAPLTQALFQVDPTCRKAAEEARSNPAEMQRRTIIEAAWQRHEEIRRTEQLEWEAAFVESKLRALNELKEISLRLFKMATRLDYGLPPIYRRMATLTPPSPEHFPIKQEF